MPKGFTDHERAQIHTQLLAKGQELFGLHGIRKTNVEEITRAVGISKGAFYLFYESKEALFFAILQQFEAEYRARLIADLARPGLSPHQRLVTVLGQSVTLALAHPLFAHFGSDEFAYLLRKLPAEQPDTHMSSDVEFSRQFIAAARAAGITITATPELMTSLLRALVMLNFHKDMIGPADYRQVVAVLVEQVATYLMKEPTP